MLGTSYGGMVAQGYAVRYPKNLDKLILSVTTPSYRFMDEAKNFLKTYGNSHQIALSKFLWDGKFKSHEHVMEFLIAMEPFYSLKKKKKQAGGFGKSLTVWSHQALNEGFGGFLQTFDFIPKLKKITCLTLVLAGEKDWICPPSQAKTIAQHIPNSKLKIFSGTSHLIAQDAHDEYIKIIKQFLRKK